MATNNGFKENALRVVAVLGLIAVLLLGAWGIIQIAFALPGFFGNLGGNISGLFNRTPAKETLTVSLPSSVTAGQPFPLSWRHQNKQGEYSYSISYSCAQGLSLAAPLPNGSYQQVPCNTAFNYINASSSSLLVATGEKAASTTVTVSAVKLAGGTVAASASAGTTVNPAVTAKPATTKPKTATKPTTKYVPSGRTQNLYGYSDLSVQMLAAPQSVRAGERIVLQFVVENIGTNAAPAGWSFDAFLPYSPVYTYPSGSQQKLYPGDKIVYTLGYDAAASYNNYTYQNTYPQSGYGMGSCNAFGPCAVPGYSNSNYPYDYNNYTSGYTGYGSAQVSVQVDPQNFVPELNESNNTATASYQVY